MNKVTQERYERIGSILHQLSLQKKLSPLERLFVDELLAADKAFSTAIYLLSILHFSDQALSLTEIAERLEVNSESATVIVRMLTKGGFEFIRSQENLSDGGRIFLIELKLKDSALTHLIEAANNDRA